MARRMLHVATLALVAVTVLLFGHGLWRASRPSGPTPVPCFELAPFDRTGGFRAAWTSMKNVRAVSGFGLRAALPPGRENLPLPVLGGLLGVLLLAELGLAIPRLVSPVRKKKALLGQIKGQIHRKDWLAVVELANRVESRFESLLEPNERVDVKLACATALARLDRLPRALEAYRAAIDLVPDHPDIPGAVARTLEESGKEIPSEWVRVYSDHLKAAPVEPALVRFFVDDLVEKTRIDSRSLDQADQQLQAFRDRTELSAAVRTALDDRIEEGQDAQRTRIVLARHLVGRRDRAAAAAELVRILLEDSSIAIVHELLWDAHQDPDDPKALYERYKSVMPRLKESPALTQAMERIRRVIGRDGNQEGGPAEGAASADRQPAKTPVPVPVNGATAGARTLALAPGPVATAATAVTVVAARRAVVRGLGIPAPGSALTAPASPDEPVPAVGTVPVIPAVAVPLPVPGIAPAARAVAAPVSVPQAGETALLGGGESVRDLLEEWVEETGGEPAAGASVDQLLGLARPAAPGRTPVPAQALPAGQDPRFESARADLEHGRAEEALAKLQTLRREGRLDPVRLSVHLAAAFLDLDQAPLALPEIEQVMKATVDDGDLYLLASRCETRGLPRQGRDLYRKLYAQNLGFKDVRDKLKTVSSTTPEEDLERQLMGYIPPRYTSVTVIGRGGMGVVFRAKDADLDRTVAIKMLAPFFKGNEEIEGRFLLEARTLARLKHPGILEIYDIDKSGIPFFAMEFLDGRNLATVLAAKERLTLGQVLRVMKRVGEILQFCHAQGVIHRDVKLENIFLTSRGETKLLDFGLVRSTSEGACLTQPGVAMGSPPYMSPEQLRGDDVDHRTDVYSFGVCLYYVCTGRLPFKNWTDHLTVPLTPPRQLNPRLPPPLDALIVKSLAKSPTDRYQGFDQLLRELSAFVR